MVLGVLNQAFDVLVLRYGVQKRIYCNVSPHGPLRPGLGTSGQARPAPGCRDPTTSVQSPPSPHGHTKLCPLHTCMSPSSLPGSPPYLPSIWREAWRIGA